MVYLQNYKEFEADILDLQSEKYGLSFDIKKYTTSSLALGDENVIGIRAFKGAENNILISDLGLSFIHMIGHVVRNNFPCLTQFGQNSGLGALF